VESKRIAAERAVDYIQDGMIVGLGTGSTAYWAIQKIGERVKNGLNIKAIATSNASDQLARELGIEIIEFKDIGSIDITIDGADEVTPNLDLIKGGGGALLREKIVAAASKRLIIVIDESKLVVTLGKFPLPVEVVPFGYEMTLRKLQYLECKVNLRMIADNLYVTDNGNYIIDCNFETIVNPIELHTELNLITGVVDNGLFLDMANDVIIGYMDGSIKELTFK